MLWYKSWLETRWRFVIGLALLMLSACGTVLDYPAGGQAAAAGAAASTSSGEIGRRITEAMELARSYRGYVWSQWFRQNLPQMWTLFAVLLGTGGLLSQASGGGGAVHAVAAGLAQPPARRARRDGPGGTAGARLRPVARCSRCSRRPSGRPTASATRSSTARACSSPAPCSSAWRSCCPPCSATCGGRC